MARTTQDIIDHADELARFEDYEPRAGDEISADEIELRRAAIARAAGERHVVELVTRARRGGVPWARSVRRSAPRRRPRSVVTPAASTSPARAASVAEPASVAEGTTRLGALTVSRMGSLATRWWTACWRRRVFEPLPRGLREAQRPAMLPCRARMDDRAFRLRRASGREPAGHAVDVATLSRGHGCGRVAILADLATYALAMWRGSAFGDLGGEPFSLDRGRAPGRSAAPSSSGCRRCSRSAPRARPRARGGGHRRTAARASDRPADARPLTRRPAGRRARCVPPSEDCAVRGSGPVSER